MSWVGLKDVILAADPSFCPWTTKKVFCAPNDSSSKQRDVPLANILLKKHPELPDFCLKQVEYEKAPVPNWRDESSVYAGKKLLAIPGPRTA